MFFLRCAFWLSVVYGSMTWTSGPFAPGPSLAGATRLQTAAVAKVVAGVGDYCARHISDCAADADRVAALFATSAPAALPSRRADVQLPVRDPRRHGGKAKLVSEVAWAR